MSSKYAGQCVTTARVGNVRQPSVRANPTPGGDQMIQKPSSSKLKQGLPTNGPKISMRLLNQQFAINEDRQALPTLVRSQNANKSNREALKKLSSNKASCQASRKPSEDIATENSNKNGARGNGRQGGQIECSRERIASNNRILAAKPVQIAQRLLSINAPTKCASTKQAQAKQNVFFENRKPTVNFKNIVQQIKSQLARTSNNELQDDSAITKTNGSGNHLAATAATIQAAIKARRLKTEVQTANAYSSLEAAELSQNVTESKIVSDNRLRISENDARSLEADEPKRSRVSASKGKRKTLACEEQLPQLRRRFVLNEPSEEMSNMSNRHPEETDSYMSGNIPTSTAPKVLFEHETFLNTFTAETVHYMIDQEEVYAPDPNYLETQQPSLRWKMRAILLDWMQEVCSDYLFKRETFYYAVNFVDRYLSLSPAVEKKNLQLVGLTALYLAAKVEEVMLPKVDNMVLAANNTYTASQITKMETNLYFTLSFRITPPTINTWSNWYTAQWDAFIEESACARENVLVMSAEQPVKFKLPTQHSYTLFRTLMQLLDLMILDIQTLQYRQRALVLSTMYILLGREYQQFTNELIEHEFPHSSHYLLNDTLAYNALFGIFLQECFGMELPNLLPTVQYVATFFAVELDISLPIAAKIDKENVLQGNFEEFLAFQTHSKHLLPFAIQKRQRF